MCQSCTCSSQGRHLLNVAPAFSAIKPGFMHPGRLGWSVEPSIALPSSAIHGWQLTLKSFVAGRLSTQDFPVDDVPALLLPTLLARVRSLCRRLSQMATTYVEYPFLQVLEHILYPSHDSVLFRSTTHSRALPFLWLTTSADCICIKSCLQCSKSISNCFIESGQPNVLFHGLNSFPVTDLIGWSELHQHIRPPLRCLPILSLSALRLLRWSWIASL